MKLGYIQLQIIKHSLQHYIARDNATVQDREREQMLLDRVQCEVDELKERLGINNPQD